jgi:glycerophosphoryl diester phosphodiesterase
MKKFLLIILFSCFSAISFAQKAPIAHAHNDYEHKRPLFDALEQGFTSFEADIHLIDGELLVAHDRKDVKPDRTLQSLYLNPLRELCKNNRHSFTLLIDIKTRGESTYKALSDVLKQYPDIISSYNNDKLSEKPVQVIVSGNRPLTFMKNEEERYAGYDGRLSDLDTQETSSLIPMISDNWKQHFQWRGEDDFPAEEKEKLYSIVQKAHAKGRTVRFWNTDMRRENQQIKLWEEFKAAGVDYINTDKLKLLNQFLKK